MRQWLGVCMRPFLQPSFLHRLSRVVSEPKMSSMGMGTMLLMLCQQVLVPFSGVTVEQGVSHLVKPRERQTCRLAAACEL